jgi:hypothetical protein
MITSPEDSIQRPLQAYLTQIPRNPVVVTI